MQPQPRQLNDKSHTPPPENFLGAWRSLGSDPVFSAPPWITIDRETVLLPSGKKINDFYRIVLPQFALVVPITRGGRYLLVRGYKHGPGRVVASPPAGLIEPGETPLAAAQRELLEETGYVSEKWTKLSELVADGNRQCGRMYLFLATDVERSVEPVRDETEALVVEEWDREEVIRALTDGQVGTLAAASGLGTVLAMT
jgi:ADP-ribose pyrophosphatase